MDPRASCNASGKSGKYRNSVKCDLCQTTVHLKCAYLNYVDSQYIVFSNKTWHCYNCSKKLFPFTTLNNYMLYPLLIDKNYCNNDPNGSCLALKNIQRICLCSEFNHFSSDINNTPENVINSKFYDSNQLPTLRNLLIKVHFLYFT